MPDDPTEDQIRREVAEAARILREDGVHARLSKIEEKLAKQFPDEPPADDSDDPNPKPPPKGEPKKSGQNKRSSLWWGEVEE